MIIESASIYPYVFYLHVACATLSLLYFTIRGYWMLAENPVLAARVNRIAPHIIDTVLLGSAVTLTLLIQQYPLINQWLTVKLFALLLYIIFGSVALKRGKTKAQRTAAFAAAICSFLFIVSVAHYHHPMGLFYQI